MKQIRELTYLAVCEQNKSGGYGIHFPDLPGCVSYGKNLKDASIKAKEALELHIYGKECDNEKIPRPVLKIPKTNKNEIVIPVTIYPDLVKSEMDDKKVKTNCTIPAYLKREAEKRGINFSQLLEASLKTVLARKHPIV